MTAPTPPPRSEPRTREESKLARSALLGAVFLMATSAIGPGFITQTATFTVQLGAAFACAIVLSVVVDVAVQLNVWRVIGVSGLRAHELGNRVLPGVGYLLAGLVVLGGVVFNVGNIAGSGLGAEAMFGLDPRIGGALSALLAIGIFVSKKAGLALDRAVIGLGLLMILATLVIAITSGPPVGEALVNVVRPDEFSFLAVTTIIGGTVGGYITYAGAHRMLDSGRTGPEHVGEITRSSVVSILVTGLMRALLFLAILGVVVGGAKIASDDPAGSAFQAAAGQVGLRVYGLVLWAAALTSVIGAAYTSVSFLTTSRTPERTRNMLTVAFIAITAAIYVLIEQTPVTLLVFAGTFNGLILPIGLGVLLWVAWRRRDLMNGYRYPAWLLGIGVLAWLLTLYLGYNAVQMLGGPVTRIDLNSDVGESYGRWELGDDAAVLGVVTSANVACGYHAGDATTLRRTCVLAAEQGVVVGAQVGYNDLAGFGRRFIDMDPVELVDDILYQIGALEALARAAGVTVRYVKPHGALYNAVVEHESQARAVVDAVRTYDPALPLVGLPGSVLLATAERAGLRTIREAFADRAYTPQGTLVPRREAGAVLSDPAEVARRVVQMVVDGHVDAIDGSRVTVHAESVCVHGDSPGAVAMAQRIRADLAAAGVELGAFV